MTETVSTQPSQLMFIRSDQASSTNSNSKTYKIAHPVTAKKGHKMLIELLEFECPISFYLFDSFNNVLNVTVVGDATTTTQTYTIPSQNYDVTALVSQLNTLFNAASTPFTIVASYDAPTMKFKLTVAAAGANSSITSFSINTPASTCLKILGYYDNLTVNGTELTGDGVANLNRTENIYIKTPNIRLDNLNGRGEFDNTLCKVQRVPVQGPKSPCVKSNTFLC